MNIAEQRARALAILTKELDSDGYSPIDYLIDTECRHELDLPPRPIDGLPYVRWMSTTTPNKALAMRTSSAGIKLIKRWEGCKLKSYLCPAGVWTIGYGHTKTACSGMKISQFEAERLLREDLREYEKAVRAFVRVPLTHNQFDALVSFTYNVGTTAFGNSTLLKILNQGRYNTAALQFHKWVYAKGRKLTGLVNRRNAEYALFTKT